MHSDFSLAMLSNIVMNGSVDDSIERVRARVQELADADLTVLKDMIHSNQGLWPSSGILMEYINVYVEDLQHVLDEENARLKPPDDEWGTIRKQQDQEYEEALRMDQEAASIERAPPASVQLAPVLSALEMRQLRAAAAEARIRHNQLPQ